MAVVKEQELLTAEMPPPPSPVAEDVAAGGRAAAETGAALRLAEGDAQRKLTVQACVCAHLCCSNIGGKTE